MAPDKKHPVSVIDGNNPCPRWGTDQAVIKTAAIRQFHVGHANVEPLIAVQGLLGNNLPPHRRSRSRPHHQARRAYVSTGPAAGCDH
jgi:hypothetical protein